MSEAVVFLDDEPEDDDGDQRSCLVGAPNGENELMISIHGPDQDASEFLTREQWEKFVRDVAEVMGWKDSK